MNSDIDGAAARRAIANIGPQSRSRLIASLARRFADLDIAEDALQDAFVRALSAWSAAGVPDSPEAWLAVTARRIGIDLVRRDAVLAQKLARLHIEAGPMESAQIVTDPVGLGDDQLGLMFACAHPTLGRADQFALTLRFVAGLETAEVANALLVPVATMQQRLVRAKRRIRTLGVPFTVPSADQLPGRLGGVLRVVYLLFASGHARSSGQQHVRDDLTAEAIRLGRLLNGAFSKNAEVSGLLALMLLTQARRPARVDSEGRPVSLADQDRGLWDAKLIAEGIALTERAVAASEAAGYAIAAAIAAVQAEAPSFGEADWAQIAVLYQLLTRHDRSPVVQLGTAVALGRSHGPERGIAELDALAEDPMLDRLRAFHVARALTLGELGRAEEAAQAYRKALDLPGNASEDDFLATLLENVSGSDGEYAGIEVDG